MEVIVISLICAISAAFVVSFSVIKRYKSGLYSAIYPLEHYTNLNLTHREDRFLNRHVTRVRVQNSSNNKK